MFIDANAFLWAALGESRPAINVYATHGLEAPRAAWGAPFGCGQDKLRLGRSAF
jgi:hypothetical protein